MDTKQLMDNMMKTYEEDLKNSKEKRKAIDEEIESKRKALEDMIKTSETIKKYVENKPKNTEELKEVMGVLCFGNLSFCCRKKCPLRNAVLGVLEIKPETFEKTKEEWGLKMLEKSCEL